MWNSWRERRGPVGDWAGGGRAASSSPGRLWGNTMLRTRILRPRGLTVALVLWVVAWLTLPMPGEGAPLPPSRAPAAERVTAIAAVDLATIREALVSQGLTPADADLVLARLTPTEQQELAQRVGELGVGGNPSLLLIAGIVILVAILLYLPMAGRMQGWWR